MSELITSIEIPKYLRRVQISKKRKEKHYEKGKKLPQKYLNQQRYTWKRVHVGKNKNVEKLFDEEENKFVVSNPRACGTPKWQVISGQAIYSGNMNHNIRAKVFKELKETIKPYIENLEEIKDVPVKIHIEVHDVIKEGSSLWDLDNRAYPYFKAFQDALTGNRGEWESKLEDDNIMFVTDINSKFIPIDDTENRKLVINIYKEDDERILNHGEYKK